MAGNIKGKWLFRGGVFTAGLIILIVASTGAIRNCTSTDKGEIMEEKTMNQMGFGRFNIVIPEQFQLAGRNQSIYEVDVRTIPIGDRSPDKMWKDRLDTISAEIAASGKTSGKMIWKGEISPGFPAVSYQKKLSVPAATVEAQKRVADYVLLLKYSGELGMEKEMLELLDGTAVGYKPGIPYGFNVGEGSITTELGLYEHAFVSLTDSLLDAEITVNTQTVGNYLNDHPLEDISHDIALFASEGATLKVLINKRRNVAGFDGYEGLVGLDSPDEESIFTYTWFFPGETANSFKPEILIKMTGPRRYLDQVKETWENLLKSFSIRKEK